MYPFLLNIAIVGMIAFGVAWTCNPLFILGLILLRDIPVFPPKYLVNGQEDSSDDDDDAQPMGFTADIK